jgi:uncharacterized protein YjbI with pentapeptide repeats
MANEEHKRLLLQGANLVNADLTDANLQRVNFVDADLSQENFCKELDSMSILLPFLLLLIIPLLNDGPRVKNSICMKRL